MIRYVKNNDHVKSKSHRSLQKKNSQLDVTQGQGDDDKQKDVSVKETLKQWLPKDFHTLLYGVLTVVCMVEAIRTGNISILVALWIAEATQVGVPVMKKVILTIMGNLISKLPKAE